MKNNSPSKIESTFVNWHLSLKECVQKTYTLQQLIMLVFPLFLHIFLTCCKILYTNSPDISEVKILPNLLHTNICTLSAINNNMYLISFLNKYVQELMLNHITIHNKLQGTTCLIKNPMH